MPFFNYDSKANVELTIMVKVNGQVVAEIPMVKAVQLVDSQWVKRRLEQLHNLRASIRRN